MGCASSQQVHVIFVVNRGWITKPHVSRTKIKKEKPRELKDIPKECSFARVRRAVCKDKISLGKDTESCEKNLSYLESEQTLTITSMRRRDRMTFSLPICNSISNKTSRCNVLSSGNVSILPSCITEESMETESSLMQSSKDDIKITKIKTECQNYAKLTETEEWNFNSFGFTDPLYNEVLAVTVHYNFFNDFGDNFDDLDLS